MSETRLGQDDKQDVKIGELLTSVGVVTSGDLTEAIQIAKRMALPIGRVIVMSGVITEQNLQYALEAQSLIRDGQLDLELAVKALKDSYSQNISLQDALSNLRWAPKQDLATNKLGELLIDSNMVTKAQLEQALQSSFETGMPLGGTLVLQGVLSAQLLPIVLNAQEQIREGKITREGAIENLKSAVLFWAKADEVSQRSTQTSSGVFDPSSSEARSSTEGKTRWRTFSTGETPKPDLKGSTSLQGLSRRAAKVTSTSEGAAEDRAVILPSIPIDPSLKPSDDMTLVDMMKLSGFCSDEDIQAHVRAALNNSEVAARFFMYTGLLKQATLDNFLRCRSLMRKGLLTPDEAVKALALCKKAEISLDEAFKDLDLDMPVTGGSW